MNGGKKKKKKKRRKAEADSLSGIGWSPLIRIMLIKME